MNENVGGWHFVGRGSDDDDGLATEGQDRGSECRRCRGRSGSPRGGEQGGEAEESPSNKGAMRARGEASLELQGVRCLSARSSAPKCKECGGSGICEHGRQRAYARSAVGHHSASTVVSALTARSAVGDQSASTVVGALVQGVRWGCNLRARSSCALSARSAVGHQSASTVVSALMQGVRWGINLRARSSSALDARSAVGSSICEHGRIRYQCKECGGSSICEHGRRRTICKECGGASICEHGRQRYRCKECGVA